MANAPYVEEGGTQLPLDSVATRSNLLKIYERRIGQKPGALAVLDELLDNSAIYSRIINVDDRDDNTALERQLLEIRRAMGVPSYLPLLNLLKNENALGLDDGMVDDLVGLLVRFFVRRNVTDTPPTRD